jgi:hypothetical protein
MAEAKCPEVNGGWNTSNLEEWIDTWLRAAGNNVALADGLKKQKRYWIGPIQFPLEKLVRCCGPEEGMEFREPVEHWNERIDSLVEHIKSGVDLAPFMQLTATAPTPFATAIIGMARARKRGSKRTGRLSGAILKMTLRK